MYFAGVDVGSRSAKVAIISDSELVSHHVADTGAYSAKIAALCLEEALKAAGLTREDLNYIMATGYGRMVAPFAQGNVSDISAHAKGAFWYNPSVRTILDLGGQDCKAINCNERGRVTRFVMNDKCAAGSGRFLEVMADLLEVPLGNMGGLSLEANETIPFSSTCAVFAKSEALGLLKDGAGKSDLLAGIHDAIATQCFKMLGRLSLEKDLMMTGGVPKNIGVVNKVKEKVDLEPVIVPDPQIVGAVGAAVFAKERYLAKQGSV